MKEPKHVYQIANWPMVALLTLLTGFVAPGHCLDRKPSHGGTVLKAQATWVPTGNLNAARSGHTATLLPNGKVLVVGGANNNVLDSAELYDPTTRTWGVTGHLNAARAGHTATLLPNGQVLVVGGVNFDNVLAIAEVYDSGTGTWSRTSNPITNRFDHTATLLQTGKVLVAGGASPGFVGSAELYDPAAGTWSRTGNLITERQLHQATLLHDGRVLVTGGANDADLIFPLSAAELYDPIAGTWGPASSLTTVRDLHSATLLPNGSVLVAGGNGPPDQRPPGPGCVSVPVSCTITEVPTNTAELFDPGTGQWSNTGILNAARVGHTATLLPDGEVLVAGGQAIRTAERYDAVRGLWANTSDLNTTRFGHTATLLPNGTVLVVGGVGAAGAISSAELYLQSADTPFRIISLFSDQAGVYQYIQLANLATTSGSNAFAGRALTVTSRNGVVKSFIFPNDPPAGATTLCIATRNVWPTPSDLDFVMPDGFLPTDGGTINFVGVDTWTFGPLPTDGHSSLSRSGGAGGSGLMQCSKFGAILNVPIDSVIEYYNQALDHYFISASQPDLDALDSGRFPGWKRTGYNFPAWITRDVPPLGGLVAPPNLLDVCRIYIPPAYGDSHFFSASAAECAASLSQHPQLVLETNSAFLATLPNPQTGVCPTGQIPIYRVWNARADSNHRFTTSIDIRNQMVARGYVAEGYGPNAVAMCLGGNF